LANLNIEDIEIVQIKTGKAKPRTPKMYMQADDEALLLMETLKLKRPRIYTWQFSDKDVKHIKFKFDKVHQAIAKFIRLWKAQVSPDITGFCPTTKNTAPRNEPIIITRNFRTLLRNIP
jgi:hypothetical protein